MSDGYNDVVDGELQKWDTEGTTIEGVLKSYDQRKDTGKGPGNLYKVKTKNGVAAFFAPQLLHEKLSTIKIGSMVKITFLKSEKTGSGNTIKKFDVKWKVPTQADLEAFGMAESYNTVGDSKTAEVKTGGAEDLVAELNGKPTDPSIPH